MPHRKIESMVVLCPLEHDKDEFEGERMIGLLFTFFLGHSVYEAHWHRGGGDGGRRRHLPPRQQKQQEQIISVKY